MPGATRPLPDPSEIRRILVTAYGHIADVLPAFAALATLRRTYPDARITVLAVEYVRELFAHCPDVDDVLIIEDLKYKNTRRGKVEQVMRLVQMFPRVYGRFDMVLVLHARTRFLTRIAWLTGARVRAGFEDVASSGMLTHPARPLRSFVSFRAENRRVLEAVGATGMGSGLELSIPAEAERAARDLLASEHVAGDEALIGLHPGSHWTCQQWTPEEWSALGDELVTRHGVRLVITGTDDERELVDTIIGGMHVHPERVINAAGRTGILEFAALIRAMDCLVCVNSAASQVALAVQTPVVNLVGYENPVWTAPATGEAMTIVRGCTDETAVASWCPYGVWGRLSQCHRAECVGIGGMTLIRREMVLDEVDRWMARGAVQAQKRQSAL